MTERLKKNSNIHIYINMYISYTYTHIYVYTHILIHTYTILKHIYYNYIQDNTNIWGLH